MLDRSTDCTRVRSLLVELSELASVMPSDQLCTIHMNIGIEWVFRFNNPKYFMLRFPDTDCKLSISSSDPATRKQLLATHRTDPDLQTAPPTNTGEEQ